METRALVIGAEAEYRRQVIEALQVNGWQVAGAGSVAEAQSYLMKTSRQVVCYLTAGQNQGGETTEDGLAALRRNVPVDTPLIVLGRDAGHTQTALKSLLNGASDYLVWPAQAAELCPRVRFWLTKCNRAELKGDEFLTMNPGPGLVEEPVLVGESPAILAVYRQLARAIRTWPEESAGADKTEVATGLGQPPTFLVTGETGTGKELLARLIHRHSRYSTGNFVPVNCGALSPELAEVELFGCEAGAFTGATRSRPGLWELAEKGTLFLDEITEAPPGVLTKLLRVLEDGQVRRLGGRRWRKVELQVIAASNREFPAVLAEGRIRPDLYHRLSQHHIHLPPLRERLSDIGLLIAHFARGYTSVPVQFEKAAMDLLLEYEWPGNVRELKNVLRAAFAQSVTGKIFAQDVENCLTRNGVLHQPMPVPRSLDELNGEATEIKRRKASEILAQHKGNITQAAAALGISRPTFYKLLT